MHMSIRTCLRLNAHVYTHVLAAECTCMHMRIYVHIRIRMHMHVHIYASAIALCFALMQHAPCPPLLQIYSKYVMRARQYSTIPFGVHPMPHSPVYVCVHVRRRIKLQCCPCEAYALPLLLLFAATATVPVSALKRHPPCSTPPPSSAAQAHCSPWWALLRTHHYTFARPPLCSAGTFLSEMGFPEAALAATLEAVALCRRLVERAGSGGGGTNSGESPLKPDLARALNNAGLFLFACGQRESAMAATEEALSLRRALAKSDPSMFDGDLARSLNNLSLFLCVLGDDTALSTTQAALKLYRRLAARSPSIEPELAATLHNLGLRLAEAQRWDAAVEASTEAVSLRRKLALVHPDVFTPALATSLGSLGDISSAAAASTGGLGGDGSSAGGWAEKGIAASEASVAVWRTVIVNDPERENDLAAALHVLSGRLASVGRADEAGALSAEADTLKRAYRKSSMIGGSASLSTISTRSLTFRSISGKSVDVMTAASGGSFRRSLEEHTTSPVINDAEPTASSPTLAAHLDMNPPGHSRQHHHGHHHHHRDHKSGEGKLKSSHGDGDASGGHRKLKSGGTAHHKSSSGAHHKSSRSSRDTAAAAAVQEGDDVPVLEAAAADDAAGATSAAGAAASTTAGHRMRTGGGDGGASTSVRSKTSGSSSRHSGGAPLIATLVEEDDEGGASTATAASAAAAASTGSTPYTRAWKNIL